MPYDLYWHGDVWAVESYRDAERTRQEISNNEAWQQGMYFYDAICCALKNAFGSSNGSRAHYPDRPYPLGDKGQSEEEKAIREENERLQAELYMRNMVRAGRTWQK